MDIPGFQHIQQRQRALEPTFKDCHLSNSVQENYFGKQNSEKQYKDENGVPGYYQISPTERI